MTCPCCGKFYRFDEQDQRQFRNGNHPNRKPTPANTRILLPEDIHPDTEALILNPPGYEPKDEWRFLTEFYKNETNQKFWFIFNTTFTKTKVLVIILFVVISFYFSAKLIYLHFLRLILT